MAVENNILDKSAKEKIEEILSRNKNVEIGIRNGKLIIWELESKKKYETAVTLR